MEKLLIIGALVYKKQLDFDNGTVLSNSDIFILLQSPLQEM